MYTYNKYISKSIFPPLVTLTVILTSLVWITQTLKLIHLIDKGIELKTFLKLITLLVPSLLFMILPVVTILAVIYVYNHLQEERQLVILRIGGLSNFDLARPALLVAILVTFFAYYLSAYLMPLSYNNLKQGLLNFKEGYVSNIIDARTFNQISKYSNIYIDKKNPDGSLEGVVLFDNRIADNRTIFFAKKGEILTDMQGATEFVLTNGLRHSYDRLGNLTKLYFDSLIVAVSTDNNNDSVERGRTSPELYIQEMIWPDKHIPITRQKQLIADGHSRLVWPLFNFAFVFLALSIFLKQPHSRKFHMKQFIKVFLPLFFVAYIHFTLQKFAYKDLNYIFFSYANVFFCIIFSFWQSTRNSL